MEEPYKNDIKNTQGDVSVKIKNNNGIKLPPIKNFNGARN